MCLSGQMERRGESVVRKSLYRDTKAGMDSMIPVGKGRGNGDNDRTGKEAVWWETMEKKTMAGGWGATCWGKSLNLIWLLQLLN